MGKAKRCRSIMLSASVAALATGACPVAAAANKAPSRPHATRDAVSRNAIRHRHRRPRPASLRGPFVYQVLAESEISLEHSNASCAGPALRLVGFTLSPEGPNERVTRPPAVARNANQLWLQNPAAWGRLLTINTGPETTVRVLWLPPKLEQESYTDKGGVDPRFVGQEDSTTASRICSASTPDAAVASIGRAEITWRLAAPVRNLAALLAQPPTSIQMREYSAAFEVLPDSTVPTFSPR